MQEMDQQFKVLSDEIEAWKKEAIKKEIIKIGEVGAKMEKLLVKGVTFQKSYTAETDSIMKNDLLDEYISQRDAMLERLPVLLSHMVSGKNSYPLELTFEKDRLEIDPKRPFRLQCKSRYDSPVSELAKRRVFFSYKEGQRFANLLSLFLARAKTREPVSVSMRDFVISVQRVDSGAGIFIQFKTSSGATNPEMVELSAFDTKLLADRISVLLDKSPPPTDYREPDDLDPATARFDNPAGEVAKTLASGTEDNSLSLVVSRIKASQGKVDSKTKLRVEQQFDYRVMLRWREAGTINVQVFMYLVSQVNNKPAIVGMTMKDVTVGSGPAQELLIDATQKVPGPMAGTVIIQCFSNGRLLKSFSSSTQHKKLADLDDIESQLAPLYRDPAYKK